uniref:Uncharacterized protein n=1 Tax=Knipowitschia caucasica TaxID=637954 RepID=A0AAV2MFP7_KNICA
MENYPSTPPHTSYHDRRLELATRKRRKEKEEESQGRAEISTRKTLGNVISVIQHTNSLSRGHMELTYHSSPYYLALEASDGPEMERDSPEKAPETPAKEPEKQVVEEFQWPQRSETLAQFLQRNCPKERRGSAWRMMEHSSGESSFESACTSLSRSPSQDSNLSYSSTYSSSFSCDSREDGGRAQDDCGKELLSVPNSGTLSLLHQRQQNEMRRSASEQAPCHQRRELPEVRSVSFDCGNLDPTAAPQSALVPVRIQTNVPALSSLTYTTVSQVFDHHSEALGLFSPNTQDPQREHGADAGGSGLVLGKTEDRNPSVADVAHHLHHQRLQRCQQAHAVPASSLDLVLEVKQQKRVKEERMFGQIADELSARGARQQQRGSPWT